jgi:hypothetical protein
MESPNNRLIIFSLIFFFLLIVPYHLDEYQKVIDFAERNNDFPVRTLLFSISFLYLGYLPFLAGGKKNIKWLLLGISLFLIHFLIVYICPHSIAVSPDRCEVIKLMLMYYTAIFLIGLISDHIRDLIVENFG